MDLRVTLDQRGNRTQVTSDFGCSICSTQFPNDFELTWHCLVAHKHCKICNTKKLKSEVAQMRHLFAKHAYSRDEKFEEEMEFRWELLQILNISTLKKNDVILEEVKMMFNNNNKDIPKCTKIKLGHFNQKKFDTNRPKQNCI